MCHIMQVDEKFRLKEGYIMGFNIETIFDLKKDREVVIELEVQEVQENVSDEN